MSNPGTCLDCGIALKLEKSKRCKACNFRKIGAEHGSKNGSVYGAANFEKASGLFRQRSGQTMKRKALLTKLCDEIWGSTHANQ